MIFRPTFRGGGTIYHYLASEFHITPRSLQRREPSFFHGNFTKQSCLFTLTRSSICKLLSNSAHFPVTVTSFDQVLLTRESFESIVRKLVFCNFSFRRRKLRNGHRSLKFYPFAYSVTHESLREAKHAYIYSPGIMFRNVIHSPSNSFSYNCLRMTRVLS